MIGHWLRLFYGVFAASVAIRGLVLFHDNDLWALMNLVTLALGLTAVIVETTLLVIDAKRLNDELVRLREEPGVPPWPVIVFLLVLSLGLTIAIRATISMLIDAQLASASKPRYTKPTSAANGRSEEDLPDLPMSALPRATTGVRLRSQNSLTGRNQS